MLELPYIKFIHILSYLNKMDKKILCFVYRWFNFYTKGVNQQEIATQIISNVTEARSSETICNITYNFEEYLNLKPEHKKKINQKFLEWFTGFTEGDGSFVVSKNKVYFDITQNLNDIKILYYIKKQLGFGKVLIRKEPHRNVGVFYVSSKENFLRLITIFNGNLSTKYKNEQFLL